MSYGLIESFPAGIVGQSPEIGVIQFVSLYYILTF